MRLAACALTSILLSGCSWLGAGYGQGGAYGVQPSQYGAGQHSGGLFGQSRYGSARQAAQFGSAVHGRNIGAQFNPCALQSANQPIPRGCRPEQVTIAGNGVSAHAPQYIDKGFGSHAHGAGYKPTAAKRARKPKLRASLGLGIDRSISGNLFDPSVSSGAATYNRAAFTEGTVTGTVPDGAVVTTTYTSVPERLIGPTISNDDIYGAPLQITGGLEYIVTDNATLYANAGYTRDKGGSGGGVVVMDELRRITRTDTYNTDPLLGAVGALTGTVTTTSFIPNEIVATYNSSFNEMKRFDAELGGRYYFEPMFKGKFDRAITPFVSASGGASRYSGTSVSENQRQRFLIRAFEGTQVNPSGDFYDVNFGAPSAVYGAQWVPFGAVKAGVEWQMTPRTALAFEAGLRYEQGREVGTTRGDANISAPVALRTSYSF